MKATLDDVAELVRICICPLSRGMLLQDQHADVLRHLFKVSPPLETSAELALKPKATAHASLDCTTVNRWSVRSQFSALAQL
jgi:hypothetical protein